MEKAEAVHIMAEEIDEEEKVARQELRDKGIVELELESFADETASDTGPITTEDPTTRLLQTAPKVPLSSTKTVEEEKPVNLNILFSKGR
jgi:hypothetical protein